MVYEFKCRVVARLALVVQVSGGTLTRTSSVTPPIKTKSESAGKIGSTQFLEQGSPPCSFFGFEHRASMGAWQMSRNLVQQSFELASERCADLTPLVYQRLFRAHPEAQAMFRTEGSDLVKGSMLAMAVEAILDFAGERQGQFRMIACEVLSHDAYGTPRELFFAFFGIIADTLRELLGGDWSHARSLPRSKARSPKAASDLATPAPGNSNRYRPCA
jgi:hemoglobin-like flavoprotein